ncbi:hypothetical protein [Actinomadura fibrosa]|uniref:Uncharacterized protein n=1 Tax=Actinomadura fibrosa TaxID=111802 RepID=A0ABW2XSL9_9ACTN|nr:hypothetical protein [Actinomadura fibrosa]
MGRVLDGVVLSAIGQVNRLMFGLSRGRVVLVRFDGVPGLLLTVRTLAEPLGKTVSVACLPDGDLYLVLAHPLEAAEIIALLDASTGVEAARGPDETAVPADIDALTSPAERAVAMRRVLSRTSMETRVEVRRLALTPVAQLRLHRPFRETSHSEHAVSVVMQDAGPTPGPC